MEKFSAYLWGLVALCTVALLAFSVYTWMKASSAAVAMLQFSSFLWVLMVAFILAMVRPFSHLDVMERKILFVRNGGQYIFITPALTLQRIKSGARASYAVRLEFLFWSAGAKVILFNTLYRGTS